MSRRPKLDSRLVRIGAVASVDYLPAAAEVGPIQGGDHWTGLIAIEGHEDLTRTGMRVGSLDEGDLVGELG